MKTHKINDEETIIIGDMAKLYNISKRTLRLYHDMGLLIPYYVDETTGYRYYSTAQFSRLDMILQMKSAGLSLKQIKQMLSTRDLSLFEAVLGEQIDNLNAKIAEYKAYRSSLERQLDSYKHMRNQPVLDSIFIEYIPRRAVYIHDIDQYDLQKDYYGKSPWTVALDQVKSAFVSKGVPLTLFQQVGCIISDKYLLKNPFICCGAFIELNDELHYNLPRSFIKPATYVCMYRKYTAMDNAEELKGIQLLLDYIRDNGYQISGPCINQVIAEASVFDYDNNSILVKLQVPINALL